MVARDVSRQAEKGLRARLRGIRLLCPHDGEVRTGKEADDLGLEGESGVATARDVHIVWRLFGSQI